MPHDIITTTTVLIAVARFEFTPSMPTFASIDVSAAKTDDKKANTIYIKIASAFDFKYMINLL